MKRWFFMRIWELFELLNLPLGPLAPYILRLALGARGNVVRK